MLVVIYKQYVIPWSFIQPLQGRFIRLAGRAPVSPPGHNLYGLGSFCWFISGFCDDGDRE